MGTIKIEGNGNFVFQGNTNQKSLKEQVRELVGKNKIAEAIELLGDEGILLSSRWNRLQKEKMLGTISFSDAQLESNRIVSAIFSIVGMSSEPTHVSIVQSDTNGWEAELLQIIKDNERKNQDAVKKALVLLESFRTYYDTKRTRAFFDRSGEKLQEIEKSFEDFKNSLSKSSNESVEKFIDRVANLIDSAIPDWPSIADAYALCVGRGMNDVYIERNLRATPNDDDAKLSAVQRIETFLGQL